MFTISISVILKQLKDMLKSYDTIGFMHTRFLSKCGFH